MDFRDDDLEQWLEILKAMKQHFLISLCFREYSLTTIRILKKFFFHPTLQEQVIQETTDHFIKTLGLLYQPDRDIECKENVRELLEALHEGTEEHMSTSELREFVYTVIKAFAKEKNEAYQQSNLVELMNKVVEHRRGEIFDHDQSQMSGRGGKDHKDINRPQENGLGRQRTKHIQ